MQFRPLVFSTYCTLCYITFWVYYTVMPSIDASFAQLWLECIVFGGTQAYCSATYSQPKLPSLGAFDAVLV